MAAAQIPEKLINFNVYLANNMMVGVADVDLPSIEMMTETIKGAGIAGEIESPVLGHTQKMTASINWRTITQQPTTLAKPVVHAIELRGAQQMFDQVNGVYNAVPVKIVLRGLAKKVELGKLQVGAVTDTKTEVEVVYMKLLVDDQEIVEIDKFNFIYKVEGEDYLQSVRQALGIQ